MRRSAAVRWAWTGWALCFVVAAPGAVRAQESPPASATAAEEPRTVLDTIVVTAQKREEDPKDVPISLTALDAEKLELLAGAGADVKFLSGRVPSLVLESSFGRAFPRFYIRGLGNTDFDLNASQPVSMIVDEIVLENPVLKGMPLWDLERTEVLRGPQGTLFGRNTPAGIVKFESKRPSQTKEGYVRASFGTYDNLDFKAALGGALSPTVSARASVLYQSQSDWVDNRHTGERDALGGHQTYAYRLQFLFEPNDGFSALLNLHGWEVDGTARIFRANILRPGSNDLVSGYRQDTVLHDGRNEQEISARGAALKLEWDFGGVTLTSVTGYETLDMFSRGDIDGGFGCGFCELPNGPGFVPFAAESADGLPDLDQITQEIRLASRGGERFDWLFGFYWFDESLQADTFSYDSLAPGNPRNGYAFQTQDATSWALFGSFDIRPSDGWTLKAGLRYTTDEKDFSAERPQPVFQPPLARPITVETDADLVTWDLSAIYEATATTNLYGRVGTGFRAPSIQGRILFCGDFEGGVNFETNCVSVADEEEMFSTEIGVKSELLDRRLRLNLATFAYRVDGQQIVAVGGQTNTARLLNADRTNGYGLELDLDYAPSSNWLVTLGASYNHTEIDDPSLLIATCFSCTITDPIVGGLARIDGNPLPHAPEWIFNGLVDYRRPAGRGLVTASLDWAYHSEKSFFLYESREFNGDSFELGFRLGYVFAGARYEVALFGRNVTDEEIVQNGIDFNNLTGMTNEPRIVGLELVYRF